MYEHILSSGTGLEGFFCPVFIGSRAGSEWLLGWFLSRRPGNPARRSSSGAKSGDNFSERAEMLLRVLKVTGGDISVSSCQGMREEKRRRADRKSRHGECCAMKQHPQSQERGRLN